MTLKRYFLYLMSSSYRYHIKQCKVYNSLKHNNIFTLAPTNILIVTVMTSKLTTYISYNICEKAKALKKKYFGVPGSGPAKTVPTGPVATALKYHTILAYLAFC